MRLQLRQLVPARPETVWPFLTDPDRMNTWSSARIRALAPGDGGGYDAVGALRQVAIQSLGRAVAFEEVIEHAEPPSRLVYRVVDGLPVRHHRGEISVAQSGDGAEVRWDVEYEFALPGLGPAARAVLLPQLGASLRKLAEVVAVAGGEPCGRCAPAPAEGALGPLRERAERVLAAQRALADRLEAADDPKRWFTRVYQYVTESQLRACDTGRVSHRAWVLHLVHRFHHYYADNLARWCGDAPGEPEAHWRSAFRAMEHAPRWYADPLTAVSYGLAKGVQAHIEEDLPRALAEVYRWHYASRCDYARLRADYLLMGGVFREASDQLLDRVPRRWFPLYLRVLGPRLPEEFKEALVTRRFYDVRRQRRKAFDRGERLAALMGRTSAPSEERATIE